MKATYVKASNGNYLPGIVHPSGKVETIYGEPLATRKTAMKFAQIHINDRKD